MMEKLFDCDRCLNTGWVCENHTDRPWSGLAAVDRCCGGAGQPCPKCSSSFNADAKQKGYIVEKLSSPPPSPEAFLNTLRSQADEAWSFFAEAAGRALQADNVDAENSAIRWKAIAEGIEHMAHRQHMRVMGAEY